MTQKQRRSAVRRLRQLLDDGVHRKQAFLQVIKELKEQKLPASQSSLYNWCGIFDVSTT